MILSIKEQHDSFMGYNYYDAQITNGLINIDGLPSTCSQYEHNNKRWLFSGNSIQELVVLIKDKLENSYSKRELIKELENETMQM